MRTSRPGQKTSKTNCMNLYRIRHSSVYDYTKTVTLGHSLACVLPRDLSNQKLVSGAVMIEPEAAFTRRHVDYFGNRVVYVSISRRHRRFALIAESTVEVFAPPVPDPGPPWEAARALLQEAQQYAIREYRLDSPMARCSPAYAEFAAPSFAPGRPLVEACGDFMRRIYEEFKYDPQSTKIGTPLDEVLKKRGGVCQDFAHLFIASLRSLGLAARYVSGYIETSPPPGRPKLRGADASHAWADVWVPDLGWVGFDPTNNKHPAGQHVILAWGRDFADVSPLRGVIFGGGKHAVKVEVDVELLEGANATG